MYVHIQGSVPPDLAFLLLSAPSELEVSNSDLYSAAWHGQETWGLRSVSQGILQCGTRKTWPHLTYFSEETGKGHLKQSSIYPNIRSTEFGTSGQDAIQEAGKLDDKRKEKGRRGPFPPLHLLILSVSWKKAVLICGIRIDGCQWHLFCLSKAD